MSVTLADIEAAAARIKGHAIETPLIESPALNDRLGLFDADGFAVDAWDRRRRLGSGRC